MERTALYRRALTPLFLIAGMAGVLATAGGVLMKLESAAGFCGWWTTVGTVVCGSSLLVVRSQALRAREPFWTPPAKRVLRALLPAFAGGLVLAISSLGTGGRPLEVGWLPGLWMILYGSALHSASFFLPRGCQKLAWIFVITGAGLTLFHSFNPPPRAAFLHLEMGLAFGGYHLASVLILKLRSQERQS